MANKYNVSLNKIHFVLHQFGFNRTEAAKAIGVSRSYLQKRIEKDLLPIPNKVLTQSN